LLLALRKTLSVIAASANFCLLASEDGGLHDRMATPSRSLILHTDAGEGIGLVALGVSISTEMDADLMPGSEVVGARLEFWVDLAEVYLAAGQRFVLGYPNRVVGRGVITTVFAV
jgi:hypothetical protein